MKGSEILARKGNRKLRNDNFVFYFRNWASLIEQHTAPCKNVRIAVILAEKYPKFDLYNAYFRRNLVPKILQPKSKHSKAIFSEGEFKDFVVPEVRKCYFVVFYYCTFTVIDPPSSGGAPVLISLNKNLQVQLIKIPLMFPNESNPN